MAILDLITTIMPTSQRGFTRALTFTHNHPHGAWSMLPRQITRYKKCQTWPLQSEIRYTFSTYSPGMTPASGVVKGTANLLAELQNRVRAYRKEQRQQHDDRVAEWFCATAQDFRSFLEEEMSETEWIAAPAYAKDADNALTFVTYLPMSYFIDKRTEVDFYKFIKTVLQDVVFKDGLSCGISCNMTLDYQTNKLMWKSFHKTARESEDPLCTSWQRVGIEVHFSDLKYPDLMDILSEKLEKCENEKRLP